MKKKSKKSTRSNSVTMRHAAREFAKKFDLAVPLGELVSEKWVPTSIGIKISNTKYKKNAYTAQFIEHYEIGNMLFSWEINRFYNFFTTVLWLDHSDKSLCGTTSCLEASMIKKVDEKKVLNKKKEL